eukprot:TRINITY_DN38675_c0_g1_i1.p2 TRINITY_DN38675_c0_g1~~TRINITY_DN38675_c0_g1_i1.p2  ORF type:complete len:235 (+),score=60.48 TRINITY_DN38675_c0_g1_i1:31-705(+)
MTAAAADDGVAAEIARQKLFLDALPYVDNEYAEEEVRTTVEKLIQEEMACGVAPAQPPTSRVTFSSAILQAEWSRLERGESMQPLDTTRYLLEPPPPEKQNDLDAWTMALTNARAQVEHQYLRLVNLELLNKYGVNAWRKHNEKMDREASRLRGSVDLVRQSIDETNRKRKVDQMNAESKLHHRELQFQELVAKNHQIEAACVQLEEEIKRLRTVPSSSSSSSV